MPEQGHQNPAIVDGYGQDDACRQNPDLPPVFTSAYHLWLFRLNLVLPPGRWIHRINRDAMAVLTGYDLFPTGSNDIVQQQFLQ